MLYWRGVLVVLATSFAVSAFGQTWSAWEHDNAVARHQDFLVIRQPGEGFCYAKQSHDEDTSKMELSYRGGGRATRGVPFLQRHIW